MIKNIYYFKNSKKNKKFIFNLFKKFLDILIFFFQKIGKNSYKIFGGKNNLPWKPIDGK